MIISCSRRTDIPAFYSDWFFNRICEGFVLVRNPMNAKQVRLVSLAPADVDCIVFWTKNPAPMMGKLKLLKDYKYYFQFTLTPYEKDVEPNLPPKKAIIDTFRKLSDKVGRKRIIWRYDPILLKENVNIEYHVEHFARMVQILSGHTEKCIISFIDMYHHLQGKMAGLSLRPPDESEIRVLAGKIMAIACANNIKVETCAEKIDLSDLGIEHGKCIDDHLISELTGINLKIAKDKNQRELCGCVSSIDIGEYNTCNHLCNYCYANVSQKKIEKNQSLHYSQSPLLIGDNSSCKSH
jgi:DNA repair photolyase